MQTITAATHDFWLVQKRTVSSEGKSVKNLARMFSLNHIRGATHHTILWNCFSDPSREITCITLGQSSVWSKKIHPHFFRTESHTIHDHFSFTADFIPALFRIILIWYCRIWSKTELRPLKTTQSKTCLIHIDDVLVIIWDNLESKTTWTLPDNHTNDKTEIQLTNFACCPHGVTFLYLPGEETKKAVDNPNRHCWKSHDPKRSPQLHWSCSPFAWKNPL